MKNGSMLRTLGLLAGLMLLLWPPGPDADASEIIYYYLDEEGTHHFTDSPTSDLYRPFAVFSAKAPDSAVQLEKSIERYSRQQGIDPDLIRAMIQVESGFEPSAVSSAGAQGLMQIMPGTQEKLGLEDPFDPEANLKAGIRYFRELLDRFQCLEIALAAYNAGPSRVEREGGIPPLKETQEYVQKVLDIYSRTQ